MSSTISIEGKIFYKQHTNKLNETQYVCKHGINQYKKSKINCTGRAKANLLNGVVQSDSIEIKVKHNQK